MPRAGRRAPGKLNQEHTERDGCGDRGKPQELPTGVAPDRLVRRDVLGAFNAFRSEFEGPPQDEGDGEAKEEKKNHHSKRPIRNIENGKNLRGDLDEQPADGGVDNRNPINIAPPQFAKEIAPVHSPTRF